MNKHDELKTMVEALNRVYQVGDETQTYLNVVHLINDLYKEMDESPASDNELDSYFVPLYLLSSKITEDDLKRYDEVFNDYKRQMKMYEDIGIGEEPEYPSPPEGEEEYKKIYMNFKIIEPVYWFSESDNANNEVIIMNYLSEGKMSQVTIRIDTKDWINLLKSLGCYVREID